VFAAFALVVVGCSPSGSPPARGDLHGAHVTVLAVWTGAEQAHFEEVLHAFEQESGVAVTYVPAGHKIADVLAERVADGTLPDLVFMPQPGLLREYVRTGIARPLDASVEQAVAQNYPAVWRDLGSVDGRLYAVWFKAANKSLVWYDVGAFERAGVIPPATLDGFVTTARALTASGTPAFALSGADAWTLTDWFENAYARLAGIDQYDRLAAHQIPWTDESVRETLRYLTRLWEPPSVAGGVDDALGEQFESSVQSFASGSGGAMLMEGDFVQGTIANTARVGVDIDEFPFPSQRNSSIVVGGGDAAVVLKDSPAAQALLEFLAGPRAASLWAAHGGFVSPNTNVDLSVYPDSTSRAAARQLVQAGDTFRFDMSDLQPSRFGADEGSGMRAALRQLLATGDVDAVAARLERDASNAYAGG
jgi:alpha-glucoside transport system substrate-binding protein